MIFPFSLSDIRRVFLKNDILSIDIGYTNIKLVHTRKKHGKLKVIDFSVGDTPGGCIRNGIISNLENIAENLRKVIKDKKISEKNVKIVISAGSNIISKLIYIPREEQQALEALIREEVSRQIPVNILEQRLFYRVTGETEYLDKPCSKVLVTVVPNHIIENYIKLIKLLDFKPLSIEIPFSSVAKFFSTGVATDESWDEKGFLPEGGNGTTAVVDLGSETTNLSVLKGGSLEFNRIILTGGRNLDEVIASKLALKRTEAENLKKLYGMSTSRLPDYETELAVDQCIRYYMGEIFENVKRSLEFYVDKCGGARMEKMILIGGGSGLKGIREFAEGIFNVPVYTLDMMSLNNIEFDENLDRDKLRYLVNALGIAM